MFVLGVCQEDVLENLIDENYSNQVLTKNKGTEEGFVASVVR